MTKLEGWNIKRWLTAALLALAFAVPAKADGLTCRSTAVYDTNTNGATKLVTGSATQRIYICGFAMMAGGTAGVSLVTGTGTNCGTGQAAITPAYPLVAQSVLVDSSSAWRGLTAAPGLDLCIKTSAGVAVQALIYYSQY